LFVSKKQKKRSELILIESYTNKVTFKYLGAQVAEGGEF
jgi:hypothetical protein